MLNKLRQKYQKEIALGCISVFVISGLIPLSASSHHYGYGYTPELHYYYPVRNETVNNNRYKNFYYPESNNLIGADSKKASEKEILFRQPEKLLKAPPIGGPTQPEMTSFKSVGTDNMVNLFTGDFSYNIPLLDVGGYPVNLFYSSGITMDQEASWVGLGWNINPGTISRTMRGVPDDFNGDDEIIKTQSIRDDETWGVNTGAGIEIVGLGLGLDANMGLSMNNRLGYATEFGVSPSFSISKHSGDPKSAGVSFSVGVDLSSRSGASVTPSINLQSNENKSLSGEFSASLGYNTRMGLTNLHVSAEAKSNKSLFDTKVINGPSYQGSNISFAYPAVTPTIGIPLTHKSFNANFKLGLEMFSVHPHFNLGGFYNRTYIASGDRQRTMPAYGMMYLQDGNGDQNALLDFNRIQDGVYTRTSPIIGMPAYTYDIFNIMGEGIGGSFRAYRSDLGYVHDATIETREDAGSVGAEIGVGNGVHGGGNLQYVYTPVSSGEWASNNAATNAFAFKQPTSTWQPVYFKNPGEKSIPDVAFQNAIGGEDLVRLKLVPGGSGSATLAPTLERISPSDNSVMGIKPVTNVQKAREKRTQLITTLTAREAARAGLDTAIFSYHADTNKIIFGRCGPSADIDRIEREGGYRKSHHVSEIDVLEQNGKRYVFGLPVYNTKQVDVTMSVGNGNASTQLSTYTSGDDSPSNRQGKDWYYEKQEIPPYTHSFLLTSIVSPNYVDVTGDGITDDDMGDAVKFNYTKSAGIFKWRTPVSSNKASYSEGLKTYPKDDKAHYIYGEREQWYLYSIESKNMVARFFVSSVRSDGRSVLNQNGGINANSGNQQLTKISLYSKADLARSGVGAKPIKTVYFSYSNKLCPDPNHLTNNGTNAAGETGKLTLESIYFTYNGNEKQKKNRYVFHYPTNNNPSYNYTDNDRWGNYKPAKDDNNNDNNPGGLSNADYPYSIQNKTKADKYAAAWTMDSITLPSGGKIGITYEADDYGYVQNRRAASMVQVEGFGYAPSGENMSSDLYSGTSAYNYIYVHLPVPVSSGTQKELTDRYFTDVKQLFMKLAVNMPPDDNGSNTGFEMIPIYADIDGYGLMPNSHDEAYIKIKPLESGNTPMVQFAFAFMKNFLPHKAYMGFDNSSSGGLKAILTALAGMLDSFRELTEGEDDKFMHDNKCRNVEVSKSFVRLSNPTAKKNGGGLRVKKIVINDNWDKMTGQYTSTYGQEYKYSTTMLINNEPAEISSGVAAWEPVIGGEENPHREVIRNLNRNKLGPFDYGVTEMPMGEMFFPSPNVGYSRVEVNSIHRDTVKNASGISVTEYYTTKDFPFKSTFTALDGAGKVDYETPPILRILHIDLMHRTTLSQGFKIDMNDMNGRVKSEATYSSLDPVNPVTKTTNYYNVVQATDNTYTFNHSFPTLDGADGIINPNGIIGRDVELMADFREHKSVTITSNLTLNLDLFWIGWFPVPLFNPLSPFYKDEKTYRSAAVTKIVNHYGVLDSVSVIKKGSVVSTKNLVYDAETGNVLLSRTNNEFNKPVYQFTYPAHWAYSGMGPAYRNIDVSFQHLTFRHGLLQDNIDMSFFESGDELYVLSESDLGPLKNQCDGFGCGGLFPHLWKNPAKRIWAVNTAVAGGVAHWVFIDRDGTPYTAKNASIRIIRSGHRNMLDQSVGSIISLGSPITNVTINGVQKQKIDFTDNTNIINTSSATFNESWRADNSFYPVDSIIKVVNTISPVSFSDTAHEIMTIEKYVDRYNFSINNYATSSSLKLNEQGDYLTRKTWLRFDKLNDVLNMHLDPSCFVDGYSYSFRSLDAHIRTVNVCTSEPENSDHPGVHGVGASAANGYDGTHEGWVSYAGVPPFFGNQTIVQIMNKPWYDYSDHNSWINAFTDNDNYSQDFVFSQILPPLPSWSYYNATGDQFTILPLIKKMAVLKRTNADLVPAFSFQLFSPSPEVGKQNIKCWVGHNTCQDIDKLTISFNYYPCQGKIDSIGSNGLGYCSTDEMVYSFCASKFNRKAINPYVEGVLGNWRPDTSYVFYGERKEKDPAQDIDTRVAGTITGFNSFWNFGSPYLTRNTSSASKAVWVWNSAITQYNRKGYEIENTDPLGRFNSGLYGYNQQLPVAVTNNAMVRETMFDGFEDYDYKTGACEQICKTHRHADFGDIAASITDSFHHTGRYSLRVNAGEHAMFSAPVTDASLLRYDHGLRIKIDSTAHSDTVLVSQGTGLNISGSYAGACPPNVNPTGGPQYPGNVGISTNHSVKWKGKLVPLQTGDYRFRANIDNGWRMKVGTTYITPNLGYGPNSTDCDYHDWATGVRETDLIHLVRGQVYDVEMDAFNSHGGSGYFKDFQWKMDCWEEYADIPLACLFPVNAAITVNHSPTGAMCTRLDTLQVTGNALTDSLSLIKGKKMLISAWVKEANVDCKCSTYIKNSIEVTFDGASETYTLEPAGNIIEGWQRYEAAIEIPEPATNMHVALKNLSDDYPVYFDDVRMHPYNANMKGFVYHSSNLRLMAELDENNYASFYEYDDDGTLTRVKKETVAGIKTITETRSALLTQD